MSKKIVDLSAATASKGTDLKEIYDPTLPAGTRSKKVSLAQDLAYFNANAQLASPHQITNLYGGGVQTINTGAATTYALTYPLALRYDFAPNAGVGLNVTLLAYDAAQCELGQPLEFRNIGGSNSAVQLFDKDGGLIANTSIAPGASFIGRLGVNTVDVIRQGTIASHDVSEFLSTGGGSMSGNLILNADATLPLQAVTYQQLTSLITTYTATSGSLQTFSLPSTARVGDLFIVVGFGAGGWKLTQGAGQTIHVGTTSTTTGATGFIASQQRYDCIMLSCAVANTDFVAVSLDGTITVT